MIYAIIEQGKVANIIEAENDTPFQVIFPEAEEFVPVTLDSGFAQIGLKYETGKFQPFESWLFDDQLSQWVAPVEKPEGAATWDEESKQWLVSDLVVTED